GKQSMSHFAASRQKLTPNEEQILVNTALESADQGFPPMCSRIEQMANAILKSRQGDTYDPVGKTWS
ncbi:hypothetical protein JB92DRAFT_2662870, partial [Gautieria morchelliformis]